MGQGTMHPSAVGQMAAAVLNTIRKRIKSATPTRGGGGTIGRVRSKRGGKAGARARRGTALAPVRSKRGGKAGTRARRIAKRATMVKGSAAAKKNMARLRRMRKKKR